MTQTSKGLKPTAPTDAGALARAISDTLPADNASSELDPLASLIARGAEQKLELLKQAGGGLSASNVSRLLHISLQAVDKRRREGSFSQCRVVPTTCIPRASSMTAEPSLGCPRCWWHAR